MTTHPQPARAVIVMGVSGSGKTTLGRALAAHLGWTFLDADDVHPPHNREKMTRGEPLTDEDRQPWLELLHARLAEHVQAGKPLVLACSALKDRYRRTLTGGLDGVALVFAHGPRDVIAARMQGRDHFMPPSLLDSQFAALEPPAQAILADIRRPVAELVPGIAAVLRGP